MTGEAPELPPRPDGAETDGIDGRHDNRLVAIRDDIALISRIRLEGEVRQLSQPGDATKGILEVAIRGRMSSAAIEGLASEIMLVLPSVIYSVQVLRASDGVQVSPRAQDLPVITVDELVEYRVFISACIRVLFAPSGRKDTIPRRIGNAVRLLAEADRLGSEAIRLALCVTAMEALLGRDGAGDISMTLAQDAAALLEPVAAHCPQAFKFVKSLYGKRSRTLHGNDVSGDHAVALQARTLAAACLACGIGAIIGRG